MTTALVDAQLAALRPALRPKIGEGVAAVLHHAVAGAQRWPWGDPSTRT